MRTDQLYSSLLFSLSLHFLLVIAAIIYIKYSGAHYKAATFVVSLVDSSLSSSSSKSAQKAPMPEEKSVRMTENKKTTPPDKNVVNERIAALEAKKKIETLARLRKTVGISKSQPVAANAKGQASRNAASGSAGYISLIGDKIQRQWVFPETIDKDLLAIINIRIARNGSVNILGFEKKSGNALFDRAALRAINNASPLPPPPQEMEIGVKFYP